MNSSLIIIQLFVLINIFITDVKPEEVTESCLKCICKASSGCKLNTKCHSPGSNSYFCGPYQISWAYWADAGKPGNTGRSNDFEYCLNDKHCAEVAVRGYMTKWKKDCNNDGVIDCLDFAAIHQAGASGCDQQWLYNSQYWNVFRQCQISTDSSTQPVPNDNPWVSSQPQPRPQPQPNPTTDSWNNVRPQTQPHSRPTLKPVSQPIPDVSYSPPSDTSDPWNAPQPQPPTDPQPQPLPDDIWDPQPRPGPTLKPQSQPYPTDDYNQPQPSIPWDQSPSRSSQPNSHRPQHQTRPTLKPQPKPVPDDTYPLPQPQPDSIDPWSQPPAQSQPSPTGAQPYSHDSYNQPQPQPYNQPSDPYNQPLPTPYDPWDAVSRAVDEIARPTPKPQAQPQPQPLPRDPWNANQPQSPPLRIPGRAPTQPISWAQPSDNTPSNFRPTLEPNGQVFTAKPLNCYISPLNSKPTEVYSEANANGTVEDNCLECICQSSSDCDLNKQCEGAYCGPYLISWAYWSDGGQPGGDYVTCANDKGCAEQAVQGYMNKWQRDCNGDGVIDCSDFATIHKLGPHSCSSEAIHGTKYWTTYQSCISPPIDARREQPNPTSASLTGRSVSQSLPTVNAFHEYPNPNPLANNPNSDEPNANPVTRDAPNYPNYFARDSRIQFPKDEPNLSQPNPYAVTTGPDSSNNITNERVFEELGLQRECLDCICHASSRCNPSIGCQNDGTGGYVCGPYQTNWAYWSEAGKPGIRGNLEHLENYQSCLNNKQCAETTVYGYMKRWKKDCNEDQQINCYDFAAIHMAGPANCNAQWFLESQYWSDFRECFDFRRKR